MEFSRQEHWSGWPFPSPGDLPRPEIKSTSLASPALAGGFFTTETPGKPFIMDTRLQIFLKKKKFICLAVLCLSCCMQDLIIAARGLGCSAACGI